MGTLSHFFYDWSNYNIVVGIFFPANESVWEHLKLALLPTIVCFFAGYKFINKNNFYIAMFLILLIPMVFIIAFFYLYVAIVGKEILFLDISIYFISVCISWYTCYNILNLPSYSHKYTALSIIGIILILIAYLLFTLYPPFFTLFKDYNSNSFGLKK